jgi:hydrogenase/urease accessory protein HupE
MNIRMIAALFVMITAIAVVAMWPLELSGMASTGLASGFMIPLESLFRVIALIAIGVAGACLGRDCIALYPLSAILMLTIGGLVQIDDHRYPGIHLFMAGAIILFSFCVSTPRNGSFLLAIPPTSIWMYFAGVNFMEPVPAVTTPIYLLLGILACSGLLIAIGVSLGVALSEIISESLSKLNLAATISTFLALF